MRRVARVTTTDASSADGFTADERRRLAPYVTNLDRPVFALTGLPEVVKGALFARYSRSPKSLRRLLLDEFLPDAEAAPATVAADVGEERADAVYGGVLSDSGDGSVEVTVDGVGQLVDVAFRGRLGDTTPHALRAAVLRAHGRAREALTAQVGRLAEEAYGPGSPAGAAIPSAYTRVHGAAGATRGAES